MRCVCIYMSAPRNVHVHLYEAWHGPIISYTHALCVYLYICTYTYTHIFILGFIWANCIVYYVWCVYLYIWTYTYTYVSIWGFTWAEGIIHAWVWICIYTQSIYPHIHIYLCMCVYAHMHLYVCLFEGYEMKFPSVCIWMNHGTHMQICMSHGPHKYIWMSHGTHI